MLKVDFDGSVVGFVSEADLRFARRSAGVVSPYSSPTPVDTSADVPEAHDEPLVVLPEGWANMSPNELQTWAIGHRRTMLEATFVLPQGWDTLPPVELESWAAAWLSSHGSVFRPTPASGQGEPHGSHDDAWAVYEYDVPDWCTTLTVLDTVPVEREPGDGWFGGGRPGKPGMYRDEEQAAQRTIYHDDEPVAPEQPAVAWDSYPSGWDRPVQSTLHNSILDKPRLKDGERRPVAPLWYCGLLDEPSSRFVWCWGSDTDHEYCPVCMEPVDEICSGFEIV